MLDSVTKKRIDDLRNILVGKIPDPKSQVEQITTGLIYKFMHDMDEEAVQMGGVPSFFTGDFEKYSWTNLFDPKLGGADKVQLYSDAIEGMYTNPSAPQLFREIFKNSFLPFKDPSTLNMFLKEINEFHYSHSEKLGDAFEYLLSFMGSQGDAGQFRTPRHIIDFIVEIVNPQKNETILDPACGTAGFLISSYKHILSQNTDKKLGDKLNAAERKQVGDNLVGYDISPDMTRISLVNMYLHQFANPQIHEYDTLSSEDRWNEYYDVILANPPFFSPKGGIQPHSRFGVSSTKAEVLFVDYIMEHLKPTGRAGIVVPEGIIFQNGNAYKTLRKKLVEDCLVGVISLPAGVFQPYSGVKTSILILDKELNQKSDSIFFAKVENDGFSLGAQRNISDKNDLPSISKSITSYVSSNIPVDGLKYATKHEILSKSDYSLTSPIEQLEQLSSDFEFACITDVASFVRGVTYKKSDEVSDNGVGVLRANNIQLDGNLNLSDIKRISKSVKVKDEQWLKKDDLFMCIASGSKDHIGKTHLVQEDLDYAFGGFMGVLRASQRVLPYFLKSILQTHKFNLFLREAIYGANINNIKKETLNQFKFPLPPIEVQQQIVDELESYQKIIDGCRQVVENHKPTINIDPSWEMVELGELVSFSQLGLVIPAKEQSDDKDSVHQFPYFKMNNITYEGDEIYDKTVFVNASNEEVSKYSVVHGDFLFNTRNTPELVGKCCVVAEPKPTMLFNNNILRLRFSDRVRSEFVSLILNTQLYKKELFRLVNATTSVAAIYQKNLFSIKIPLPSIELQNTLVDSVLLEKKLVGSNQQLIEIYTQKIQDRISKVWGE